MATHSFWVSASARAAGIAALAALVGAGCGSVEKREGEDDGGNGGEDAGPDGRPRPDAAGDDANGGPIDDDSGPSIEPPDWFVDPIDGDDANEGTRPEIAFRTIRRALQVAGGGDIVQLAPGRYDTALGETFPIAVPEGVTLRGDEATKGANVVIAANASAISSTAIAPGVGSTLAGLTIHSGPTAEFPGVGVDVQSSDVTIQNCTLSDSPDAAIGVRGGSNGVIRDNLVVRNPGYGLVLTGDVAARIEGNVIRENGIVGVYIDTVGADLGGGPAGSAGGNAIACNGQDLAVTDATATFAAANNAWDHVPPSGDDIDNQAGAVIDLTGATLAPEPCP